MTRRPKEELALNLRLDAGEHGNTVLDAFLEGGLGDLAFRLSAGVDHASHWMDRRVTGRSVRRANLLLRLEIPDGQVTLDAGLATSGGRPYVGLGYMDLDYMTNLQAKAELKYT